MKRTSSIGAIISVAALLVVTAVADDGSASISSSTSLNLSLSADKLSYVVDEEVLFTRIFVNNGDESVEVFPFRYMNDQLRFHWINTESLVTRRYGDGKCGGTPVVELQPGQTRTETMVDNVVTADVGRFFVFISCKLPDGSDVQSNVIRIDVVGEGQQRQTDVSVNVSGRIGESEAIEAAKNWLTERGLPDADTEYLAIETSSGWAVIMAKLGDAAVLLLDATGNPIGLEWKE